MPAVYRRHAGGVWSLLDDKAKMTNKAKSYGKMAEYYYRIGKKDVGGFYKARSEKAAADLRLLENSAARNGRRIAMLTQTFWPVKSGMEMFFHNLASGFVEEGYEIVLFAPEYHGITYDEVNADYDIVRYKDFQELGQLFSVRDSGGHFDGIVVQSAYVMASVAIQLGRAHRIPVVLRMHGEDIQVKPEIGYGYRLDPKKNEIICNNICSVQANIAISEKVERLVSEIPGHAPVYVIHNGVDTDFFKPDVCQYLHNLLKIPYNTKIVLAVGRNVKIKAFHHALKAFKIVSDEYDDCVLVHCGKDGNGANLGRLAKELGLEDRFFRLEEVDYFMMPKVYNSATVFLFPSSAETFGNVTVEAMACGLPCVEFDYGANHEKIRSGHDGFIVPFGDINGMARHCIDLLGDETLYASISRNARESVSERFSWGAITKKYIEAIDTSKSRYKGISVVFAAHGPNQYNAPNISLIRVLPRLKKYGVDARVIFLSTRPGDCVVAKELQEHGISCSFIPWKSTENAVVEILKDLRKNPPDVFCANLCVPAHYATPWIRDAGIPVVSSIRSDDEFYHELCQHFIGGEGRFRVSGAICVSNHLKEIAKDAGGEDFPVLTCPSGAPIPGVAAVRRDGEPLVIVYSGRFEERQKRIVETTDALISAARRWPDINVWMLGDGSMKEHVADMIERSGLSSRFWLPGRLDQKSVLDLLPKAHVFVLLSDYEGLSTALVEAMASGLVPVVKRTDSGLDDIIQGGANGLIVEDRSEGVLGAVESLYDDKGLWERLSKAARDTVVQGFSSDLTAKKWAQFFDSLRKGRAAKAIEIPAEGSLDLPRFGAAERGIRIEDFRKEISTQAPAERENHLVSVEDGGNDACRGLFLNAIKEIRPLLKDRILYVGTNGFSWKKLITPSYPSATSWYLELDDAGNDQTNEGMLHWDGKRIALGDNSIDCAIAVNAIEYFRDPVGVVAEIRRVLRPDGVFVFAVPALYPLNDGVSRFYRHSFAAIEEIIATSGLEDCHTKSIGGWNASLAQMIGLWLKRAPMDANTRNHMAQQLWPLYTQLIKSDVPLENPKAGNAMTIGWSVLAFKPAESTVAEDVFERGDTRVCLVRSHAHNYSETFIQDHVDYLSENLEVVYGHPYPHMGLDGQPVFSAGRLHALQQTSDANQKERIYDEALADYFQRRGFAVVLAESGLMGSFIYRACEIAKVPFVVHFHGADAFVNALIDQLRPHFDRFFHSAAALVVVSRAMRDQLLRLGAPEDKVILGPYGVSIAQTVLADPKHATPIFLAVGRFVEKKSPHLTIKAFEKVWKEVPEARLIMVGDGPLLSHCKKLVEALGLDDAVTFAGVFSRRAVSRLMQTSRCFVQHSVIASNGDSEGLPLAILEAGAHGLPVVATRHAGIPDAVIEGEHGFLVDEQDVDAMAAAMLRMARDSDLAGTMGKAYRQRIEARFTRAHAIQRLQGILAKAAEEGFKGGDREGELGKGTHIKDNEQSAPFFQDGSNALEATEGQGNGGLRERRLRERIGLDRNDGHGYLELAEHFVQKEDFEQAYICFKEAERVGGLPDQVVPIVQQMEQNPHLDTPVVCAYRERIGLNGSGKADLPRRILVFTNLLPPQEMGGYGRTVWELCDGLLKRGHTVRILTSDMPRYAKTPEPGWERVEKHVDRWLRLYGDWDQGAARVLDDTEQIATIVRHNHHAILSEVDRFAPDACMAGNLDFVGAGFIDPILEKGIPVVHRLGNARPGYPAENTPKSPLYCLAGASHWINQQLQQAGYLAENFDVLPPGSPLHAYYRAFLPRFDRLRICFAGLVMAYKGPHVLVQALSLLKKAGVDFTCEIAGDPKDPRFGEYLRQMIAKEDLDKAVRLIGFQSRKSLAALYARSNTMVFPSVFEEPFGKSQIEAQAAGLAVVSSGTGGCADIIENGTNGLIFKNQDPQDLARQLFRLDNDKDLWKRLARQGQRDAFRYTTGRSVATFESIVEKLISEKVSSAQ
jgi:glycosyltransferase involved in cell wall biosynthesis